MEVTDKILNTLNIDKSFILGMYLVGSNLWGTARKDSDLDVIIVIKNNNVKKGNKYISGKDTETSIHNSNVDAWIISENKFAEAIENHRMYELMCLYVPEKNKLINYSYPNNKFIINPKILYEQTLTVYTRDWEKANKQGGKNNLKRAEKILLHCTRNLFLTLQLLCNGKIETFDETNKYVRQVWEPIPNNYQAIQLKFQTIHYELMSQINKIVGSTNASNNNNVKKK